ncbi:MAG: hypothetical protein IPK50_18165 [Fibrobacterota bacterium]|nr:hypothetical protein [Fibrobacterota bacterium]QQS04195.1 MAG: hypothetical protein IPK50_18165 [Fibrobacterota bacterium]
MPDLRSLLRLLTLCLAPLHAGDWTLVEIRGHWGLRLDGSRLLSLDGRLLDAVGKASDSLEIQVCSDSLEIVSTSPDSLPPYEQEARPFVGPARMGGWTRYTSHTSHLDLMAGTGSESPWRKVNGPEDSGYVQVGTLTFCGGPELTARLKQPTLVRSPFLGLASRLLASSTGPARWRRVSPGHERLLPWPGDTSFGNPASDTTQEDDFRHAQWVVVWPGAAGDRWIAGKANLVQIRVPGAPARFIHYQDGNRRIAQRVEPLGASELVMEWTAIYGDGNWDEIARIGPDRFRFTVNGGMSGGEGHEISPEEAKRAASGTWRIDRKTRKIFLKKWRQREKVILER